MKEDEIIDKLLKRAEKHQNFPFFELYEEVTEIDLDGAGPDLNQAKSILQLMKYHELFEEHDNAYYTLTGKAIELNRSGGWLKEIKKKSSEEKKKKRLSKFDIVIRVVGLVFTAISILLYYWNYQLKQETQRIELTNQNLNKQVQTLEKEKQELKRINLEQRQLMDSLSRIEH